MMKFTRRWTDEKTGFRWYEFENLDSLCVSVTTILSIAVPQRLKTWFKNSSKKHIETKSKTSADAGTKLHSLLEKYTKNDDSYQQLVDDENVDVFEQFRNWYEALEVKALQHELEVCSTMGFAGSLDFLCQVKDKIEVWDYKTGFYSVKTGWQLAAYRLALLQNSALGQNVGMRGLNLKLSTRKFSQFEYEHIDFCAKAFLHCFETFKALYFNQLSKPISGPNGEEYPPPKWVKQDGYSAYMQSKWGVKV